MYIRRESFFASEAKLVLARGTPQAGLRGLGLAGLCEFGTVGRRPRWIFREPVESLDTTQLPPDRTCTFLPRRRRGKGGGVGPARPSDDGGGGGGGKGLLVLGRCVSMGEGGGRKGKGPSAVFANLLGVSISLVAQREIDECPMTEKYPMKTRDSTPPQKGEEKKGSGGEG